MDFIDQLRALGDKVSRLKEQIQTEEATKNAFIMPFINALGYDVFNPMEVIPEYVADLGIKKGEKVDYAIFKDGNPIIIIECKWWGEDLNVHNSQLHRYFHVTHARFGILTNGITYRFYTDLEEANKMDDKPFLEFSITDIRDNIVPEIKKFHKSSFNVDEILSSASELKYSKEIRAIMNAQLSNPTDDFVRFFATQVYKGRLSAKVLEQFVAIVKKSLNNLISDLISDRLKNALEQETSLNKAMVEATEEVKEAKEEKESKVITTEEELEAFHIIKAVLRPHIRANRIVHRDNQSYMAILMDDNNRKPICRLYLNGNKKQIGLFDEAKKETLNQIQTLEDIYNFSELLIQTALRHPEKVEA